MEKILFGTQIPVLTAKTIADVLVGEVFMKLYNMDESVAPLVVGSEVTAAQIRGSRGVQFIRKDSADSFDASTIILTKTRHNVNYQAYVAGVAGVYKLGDNAGASTSLAITDNEEGTIRLADLSVEYIDSFFPANISATKKASETTAQYLTRVVALINADPVASTLVTAALETNTTFYQIKLTTKNSDIKLGIATDGVFEGFQPITVTPRVISKGAGKDMVAIESELTVFKGNGNYTTESDLWYKEPLKGSIGTNYNTLSLSWTAVAQPTISTTMFPANLNLLVCVPTGNGTLATVYTAFNTPA